MPEQRRPSEYYPLTPGEKIDGRYWAHSQIGRGSYGTVVKAYNYKEATDVALKFFKTGKSFTNVGISEVEILELIHRNNPNKRYPIIMYITTFIWKAHFCIVLPLYSYNLYYSVKKNTAGGGFSYAIVRRIATQLLECLFFLQHPEIRLVHTDIKPDNVLFVSSRSTNIRLIDFGSAIRNPPVFESCLIQTIYYRSPEVILNLPFSYPIDMWSLGCLLIEIKTGHILFEESHEMDLLRRIIEYIGYPSLEMLIHSNKFDAWFVRCEKTVRLRDTKGRRIPQPCSKKLNDFVHAYSVNNTCTRENEAEMFIDLIKRMLVYDQSKRLTPIECLKHPFIASSSDYSYIIQPKEVNLKEKSACTISHTASESDLCTKIDCLNMEVPGEGSSTKLEKTTSCQNIPFDNQIKLDATGMNQREAIKE